MQGGEKPNDPGEYGHAGCGRGHGIPPVGNGSRRHTVADGGRGGILFTSLRLVQRAVRRRFSTGLRLRPGTGGVRRPSGRACPLPRRPYRTTPGPSFLPSCQWATPGRTSRTRTHERPGVPDGLQERFHLGGRPGVRRTRVEKRGVLVAPLTSAVGWRVLPVGLGGHAGKGCPYHGSRMALIKSLSTAIGCGQTIARMAAAARTNRSPVARGTADRIAYHSTARW